MNIRLHIERLVLDAVSMMPDAAALLHSAVETDLARLLSDGGLASGLLAGGAVPHITGGAVQLTSANEPVAFGRQIAQSVYGGIGR